MQPTASAVDSVQESTSPEGATEAGYWQMYEAESFAPLGLYQACRRPTAYAVGCILAPLRGFSIFL